jgi:hypothetical protein
MARQLLKDVHPICDEILNGEYDDILHAIEQSISARRKRSQAESGIRPNVIVRVDYPSDPQIDGVYAYVKKVNKKSVGIVVLLDSTERTDDDGLRPLPMEYRVSPNLLRVVDTLDEDMTRENLTERNRWTRECMLYWEQAASDEKW